MDLWPTTYTIAADIYQVKPDKDGNRWIADAQHGAVKRALEGLQRKGRITGFRDLLQARTPGIDGHGELAHIWMTEAGLARWLQACDGAFFAVSKPTLTLLRAPRVRLSVF